VSTDVPRLPDGFVDPLDQDQVTAVLAAVRASLDGRGLLDLLERISGLAVDPGRPQWVCLLDREQAAGYPA
jgi:hypothetical protein